MELTLSDDERALLQEVLSSAFRDLRMEIVDTDNHAYKARLRERETLLKGILDRVGGVLDL
jgi:hypothetical protein